MHLKLKMYSKNRVGVLKKMDKINLCVLVRFNTDQQGYIFLC